MAFLCFCVCVTVSDRRGQPTIRDVDFGDGGQKNCRSSGVSFKCKRFICFPGLQELAIAIIITKQKQDSISKCSVRVLPQETTPRSRKAVVLPQPPKGTELAS